MSEIEHINDHLLLIVGHSTAGKTASLKDLEAPEKAFYLNCESGKRPPFRPRWNPATVTDPYQVIDAIAEINQMPDEVADTIIIDTLTYLMDMYETQYIHSSATKQNAWGDFQQYFKTLMQQHVAASTKNIIFLAHLAEQYNEAKMIMETKVPIKGALKANGIESYFSVIVSAEKVPLKLLQEGGYESDMLNINDEDRELGYKHCFQTRLTKDTIGSRIRGPMDMWDKKETYIDNNVQFVINRLRQYYA